MNVQERFNEANLPVSEMGALTAIVVAWFDAQDLWIEDPLMVERVSLTIGVLARIAEVATSKMDALETAIADAQPALSADQWDFADDPPAEPPVAAVPASMTLTGSTRSGA